MAVTKVWMKEERTPPVFGYIRPCKPELRMKEFEMYRGVYCSLCRSIGRHYGFAARMTLSYDCTFLAMLSLSMEERCDGFQKGRCGVNPLKKCTYLKENTETLLFPATVSVLLTYFKIRDNLHDRGILNRIAAFFLLPIAYWPMKKARKGHPALYETIADSIAEQAKVETDDKAGVDAAAHPTAHMLEALLGSLSDDSAEKHVLSRLGYFIGRWVYLMDAAADLEDDRKKGNYNPFLQAEFIYTADQLSEILTLTINQAIACFDLIEVHHFHDILQNILVLGLINAQREMLKTKGNQHGRSL